jgi:putative protease
MQKSIHPVSEQFIKIHPNKKVNIKIGDEVYRNIDVEFEKELAKPVKRQIGVNIVVSNGVINISDEDNVTISSNIPMGEPAKNPEKMKETFIKQFSKTGEGDFYIADIKIAPDAELSFLPVSVVNGLRRDLFGKLMLKRLEVYEKNRAFQKPLKHVQYFVPEVDYRANIHNKSAKEFYEKCGVKVLELSFETKEPNREAELMHCKHCIKYALNMCKSPKKLFLRDSHSKIYPLKFNCKACEMFVMKP